MLAVEKQKKNAESGSLGAWEKDRLIVLKDGHYRLMGKQVKGAWFIGMCVCMMWVGWNLRGWLRSSRSDDGSCLSNLSVRQGHHQRNK